MSLKSEESLNEFARILAEFTSVSPKFKTKFCEHQLVAVLTVAMTFIYSPGLFDRRDSWGSPQHPHDPRAPPRDEPRDPRMMRGPGPPPPDSNDNKPAIRPLMSLSPPPLPIGQGGFDFGLDEESWKGTADRRDRKRSGEQEGFRDGEWDRGPPKPMRAEDEWRRGRGNNLKYHNDAIYHPNTQV